MTQGKGGTGKSTVSANVGVAASAVGLNVALIDGDPQGSLLTWKEARHAIRPYVIAKAGRDLPNWLANEGAAFDLVIVDTPAHDMKTLAEVASIADLSIIVTQPTRLAVAVAMHVRHAFIASRIDYAILLSQAPPRLNARLAEWLAIHSELGTVVGTQLAYRVAFQDSIPLGLGVIEYEPDGRAAEEVMGVTDWILNKLEMTQ
jgi:chromosome partitioning protein